MMVTAQDLVAAKATLGGQLAARRHTAGYSQAALARLVFTSRSSIANVEVGRQVPTRDFWVACDDATGAGGALVAGFDHLDVLRRRHRGQVVTDRRPRTKALDQPVGSDGGPDVGYGRPGEEPAERYLDADLAMGANRDIIGPRIGFSDHAVNDHDLLLAVVKIDDRELLVPLSRRMLMSAGGALGVATFGQPLLAGAEDIPLPTQVGVADVAELEQATDLVATFDLRHGGRLAAGQGQALLRWALRVLGQAMPATMHDRWCSAAGYLADRTGWALFDCGRHGAARHLFEQGLELANRGNDVDLRTQLLCDMAGQAVFRGRPTEALRLVDGAEHRTRTPQLAAAVHGVRAEAHAALGSSQYVWHEIGHAEEASVRTESSPAPRWLSTFRDEAGIYASTGYAAYLLARTGDSTAGTKALTRLSTATTTLAPSRTRAVVFGRSRLAVLHLTNRDGDLDTGAAAARQVVDHVQTVRSARLARELRALHTATARHDHHPQLRQLTRDLDTILDQLD